MDLTNCTTLIELLLKPSYGRYSELEKLHMALEEVTWSADRPGDVPFPPKEMFPNVERRKLMFAR